MRALALIALTGCRSILGIEDVVVPTPDDASLDDSRDDASLVDAPTEAPPMGCPASYMTLPSSGPRGHRYLLVTSNAPWMMQRNLCISMSGFLAFPDGATLPDAQAELAAISALAGDNVWLGVDDLAVEGQYRNSLGQPISAITNMLINFGGPNPGPRDCMINLNNTLQNEDCGNQRKTVCECIP
jgi:hypothetical protein